MHTGILSAGIENLAHWRWPTGSFWSFWLRILWNSACPCDILAMDFDNNHNKYASYDTLVHYDDVIMTMLASQITSLTVVYLTIYSDADQRKHQSSASLAFVWGIHRDRWIPRTKSQLRGKCFPLMTSSCGNGRHWPWPSRLIWPFRLRIPGKGIQRRSCTLT